MKKPLSSLRELASALPHAASFAPSKKGESPSVVSTARTLEDKIKSQAAETIRSIENLKNLVES